MKTLLVIIQMRADVRAAMLLTMLNVFCQDLAKVNLDIFYVDVLTTLKVAILGG